MSLSQAGEQLLQCANSAVRYVDLAHKNRTGGSRAIASLSGTLLCALKASAASVPLSTRFLYFPDRVLLRIMIYLPVVDRIAMSCTCNLLRARSLEMAELWSKVAIQTSFPVFNDRRAAMLQSRAAQLATACTLLRRRHPTLPTYFLGSMDISNWSQAMTQLMETVLEHATFLCLHAFVLRVPSHFDPHLTELATTDIPGLYTLPRLLPREEDWKRFLSSIMLPAPRLETLQVAAWVYPSNRISNAAVLPRHLLGGVSNALKRVILRGNLRVSLGGYPAFSSLTMFDWIPSPATISMHEIEDILLHMPLLEVLGLRIKRLFEDSHDPNARVHRRLRSVLLELYDIDPDDYISLPVRFFQERTLPKTRYISVDLAWRGLGSHPFGSWADLQEPLCTPESIHVVNGVLFAYGPQWRVVAPCAARNNPPLSDADMFKHLVMLTLSELLWECNAGAAPFPDAPCLRRLCIEIFPCCGPWRIEEETEGIFVAAAHMETPWRTPALEELELGFSPAGLTCFRIRAARPGGCTVSCHEGGVLALSDVSLFVRSSLVFDRDRLKRISLTGVRAVADDEPGMAYLDLESLTEELEITSSWSDELVDLGRKWQWRMSHDAEASAPTAEPEFHAGGTRPLPVFTAEDGLFSDASRYC